jgi:C4-dicarboxylate transporter DctM subunit
VGALIFSVFISLSGLAEQVAQLIGSVGDSRIVSLIVIGALLLLLGSVLDGLALMLVTTPIILPIIQDMGMSPIWFGIFLVRAMEVGFVHPPIGMNLYVIHNIAKDVSLARIFKGVLPFLASDFVHLLLLIFIPAMVTWLPTALGQ